MLLLWFCCSVILSRSAGRVHAPMLLVLAAAFGKQQQGCTCQCGWLGAAVRLIVVKAHRILPCIRS